MLTRRSALLSSLAAFLPSIPVPSGLSTEVSIEFDARPFISSLELANELKTTRNLPDALIENLHEILINGNATTVTQETRSYRDVLVVAASPAFKRWLSVASSEPLSGPESSFDAYLRICTAMKG